MHYIWIGLILIVVFIDLETSNILLTWLAPAFLMAFVLSTMGVSFGIQVVVAGLIAFPLLILGNYISKKFIKTKIEPYKIGAEKLIGAEFICDKGFDGESSHQLNGVYWKILTEIPIEKGEKVRVTGIQGNRLQIEKIKQEKE